MPGILRIGLAGSPPRAIVSRDADVPDNLWNGLGRNIAPDSSRLVDDRHISVPVERLLATRGWLAAQLDLYGCAVEPSPQVRAVLARHDSERAEIDAALRTGIESDDLDGVLDESRFCRELRPFQKRDLAHLLALSHGANFSVPGAGKTTVAYALYEAERRRLGIERLLVVAPLSAFDAWLGEAEECLDPSPKVCVLRERPRAACEVLLVNYQRLSGTRFRHIAEWVSGAPCHLILDEAHRMKRGRNGEWGAACLDLAYLAVRRDIMTGTPAPQHPSDLVALLDFLWPDQAKRILPAGALQTHPDQATMHTVSQRMQPLFVRTKKHELDLPDPSLRVELCEMGSLQDEIYTALRTRMARMTRSAGRDAAALARMGRVTMYLLQAASNPALLASALGSTGPSPVQWPLQGLSSDSGLGEMIRDYPSHELPTKFGKLATLVAANARMGLKTLVWSNFTYNLTELVERVLAPYEPAMIRGDVPTGPAIADQRTRDAELHRFRYDDACQVLVANPAAMSEGVSLHHWCHDAIYLDRTFNAGQYLQSLDRIHRLGLRPDDETRVTFLCASRTIDETIDARLRIKTERLSVMLDDEDLVTMALPDEEDGYGDTIDAEDFDSLFEHLRLGDD